MKKAQLSHLEKRRGGQEKPRRTTGSIWRQSSGVGQAISACRRFLSGATGAAETPTGSSEFLRLRWPASTLFHATY
jgi:hypothetical protein